MTNNSISIKMRGRLVNFPVVDGLTEMEMNLIIGQVEEKIKNIEEKMDIADTGKLATLAAYDFAVELYNLRQKSETNSKANLGKVDELITSLEKALDSK